jgi:hypothetical protein
MKRTTEVWLSVLIVALALTASSIGLLHPSIYRDPAVLLPQAWGTDLVTLFVATPLLGVSTVTMRRASPAGRLLWLGALGYMVYAYGMYALGTRWNELFLVYVALFGLSLYAVIIGLVGTDAARIRAGATARIPVRTIAGFLLVIAILVAGLWLADEIPALLRGAPPPSLVEMQTPTNIVHVFDLGVVLPALCVAAVLLLRDRPWGYVLSGMLLVKATAIGFWILAMAWFMARAGFGMSAAYVAFFTALTVLGIVLSWLFLSRLSGKARGSHSSTWSPISSATE